MLPLWPRIKGLHVNLSAYDAQYVALAGALGVSLVTADARIAAAWRRDEALGDIGVIDADGYVYITGGVDAEIVLAGFAP